MDALVTNHHSSAMQEEILAGLSRDDKFISPKFFYDHHGSELFSQIMELPEYYLTRTERKILKDNVSDIAKHVGLDTLLIEPGAGNCEKVTYLLDALRPRVYYPQDISYEFLSQTAEQLRQQFDWLKVEPISGDFHDEIVLPNNHSDSRRVVFYPGSTIGNFDPTIAKEFLNRMRKLVGSDGGFIIGVDLHKDSDILNDAYNDNQGITAKFNLNVLAHINELMNANFDVAKFAHIAYYNEELQRIEMHLESLETQVVQAANHTVSFTQGERIHTENSYKYSLSRFRELTQVAGLTLEKTWMDQQSLFSVHYLTVA